MSTIDRGVKSGYRTVGILLAVVALAGCGSGADHVTVTLPVTKECDRLSRAYYDAVGDRITADYGTAAYKAANKAVDRFERELSERGCWP